MAESLTPGAIVAALVARAAESENEGTAGIAHVADWLRGHFNADGDEPAATQVDMAEQLPDSATALRKLANAVDARAHADEDFRGELGTRLEQTRQAGVDVDAIAAAAWSSRS